MWCKAHQYELIWFKNHQAEIRSDLYCGLADVVDENEFANMGRRTMILPASHTGSERWWNERFRDAMHIVCKLGRPSVFLTFTCNHA